MPEHQRGPVLRPHVAEGRPYLPEPSGEDADPETAALSAERREEIKVALGTVRAEHRAALVLRHMEGLSYAEIAAVLEVPDGTAKGWVSRGRAAMLVALTQERMGSLATGEPDGDKHERRSGDRKREERGVA